jgi:hypothetical protein
VQSPEAFIETYASAWKLPPDGEKIAEFYNAPCLTLRGDGSFLALQTRSEVRQYFQSIAETYERRGIAQPSFKDLTSHRIGSRSALATVTWIGRKADGTFVDEWCVSYSLIEFEGLWRIVLATTHLANV